MELIAGGNTPVPTQELSIDIQAGAPLDASCFRLFENSQVHGDLDMCFYGQPINDDQTISLQTQGNHSLFRVKLGQIAPAVQKLAFAITCDHTPTVAELSHLSITVKHTDQVIATGRVDLQGRQEAALILGELYRRNDEWKFRFIAQGFNGGLQPLAEHFGIDIAEPPTPTATNPVTSTPAQKTTVNLSKVSLTKEKPTINLSKKADFGQIRINLNWHRGSASTNPPKGFFGKLFSSTNNDDIDLDLGAFVRLKSGHKDIVQALGNKFGRYRGTPYTELQGDDRTGAVSDGEWIHINGKYWAEIEEVLIYTFIYDGVPSWDKTDGVVTIHMPNQPPIETRLTEGTNQHILCAIARLVNENGSIKVERINRYFTGQHTMDQAFGWGFQWRAGSK